MDRVLPQRTTADASAGNAASSLDSLYSEFNEFRQEVRSRLEKQSQEIRDLKAQSEEILRAMETFPVRPSGSHASSGRQPQSSPPSANQRLGFLMEYGKVEAPQEAEHATPHQGLSEALLSGTVGDWVAAAQKAAAGRAARAEAEQRAKERALLVEERSRLREENARLKEEQEQLMGQVHRSREENARMKEEQERLMDQAQEHQRLHKAACQRALELQSQIQAEQALQRDLRAQLVRSGPACAVDPRASSVPPVCSSPVRAVGPTAPSSSSFRPFSFLLSAFLTDSEKQEQPTPDVV